MHETSLRLVIEVYLALWFQLIFIIENRNITLCFSKYRIGVKYD